MLMTEVNIPLRFCGGKKTTNARDGHLTNKKNACMCKCSDKVVWPKMRLNFVNPLTNNSSRPVRIQSICRQQNQCNLKTGILPWMGRKHCGKRRKC